MLVETMEPGWIPSGAKVLMLETMELAWILMGAKDLLVETWERGWTPLGAKVLVLDKSLLGSHWRQRIVGGNKGTWLDPIGG